MSVYAGVLGAIWRTLESYGVDPSEAIPAKFYRPGDESSKPDRVRFDDYDAIQARAAALVQDPAVGLRVGRYLQPSHLGALGFAWLSSSTLRTALQRTQRFRRMFHEAVELCLDEKPDSIRVHYRMSRQPTRPRIVADAQLAGNLTLCRASFGAELVPLEVTLRREQPADPTPWNEYFGVEVRFGQPLNSLAISVCDADRPLTGSNRGMVRLHEEIIERHLLRLDRDNILNRARLEIMERLPSGPVVESEVAGALNVSKRTMQRKFREQGETFRSLLVGVRKDLARRYLENPSFSITEIAFLLGYTDTSAFSRAFKEWFGASPSQLRSQLHES
jgi:AraC-like DNA-binding protein